jgi:3-oxoacyl-[acyl-carrier-protein] synthase II
MALKKDIVITAYGVISPIGVTNQEYWDSMLQQQSGVGLSTKLGLEGASRWLCAEAPEYEAKKYVRSRPATKKSFKVMSDDILLGYAAACQACNEVDVLPGSESVDPERLGVLFGADLIGIQISEMLSSIAKSNQGGVMQHDQFGEHAMGDITPLWMLKYLPNMPACHIGIGHDARGPNNSLTLEGASSLAALSEACRTIERGQADAMIAGGTSCRINAFTWSRSTSYRLSKRINDPAAAMRPFDTHRDGTVLGEGAAAFILETREHAEARGVKPLAQILGFGHRFHWHDQKAAPSEDAIRGSIEAAIQDADVTASDIDHVNADGLSDPLFDASEAKAIRAALGDVPVTAPKSYFGNLSAAAGAVEMVATLKAFEHGQVPATLNYETPDPECPVNVVQGEPLVKEQSIALLTSLCRTGRAASMVIAKA